MKNILKVLIITAGLVISFNVNSFALVDGAAWGGVIFNGEVEGDSDATPMGWDYGAKAHYNFSVPFFEIGVGAYYEYSKIKTDIKFAEIFDGSSAEARKSIGLDANLILSIPLIPLNPYIRGTYAAWDQFAGDTKYFSAYGIGAGLELVIFPLPSIRLFGEYMYDYSDHDAYIKTHQANFGVKVSI